MPVDEFQALHLYKASFRQPVKFPNLSPKNIKIPFAGRYIIWGLSSENEYNLFIYVLSQNPNRTTSAEFASNTAQVRQAAAIGVTAIIAAILAVLGLGLSIVLFKNVEEVLGAGGLGITIFAGLGLGGFFVFKKLT